MAKASHLEKYCFIRELWKSTSRLNERKSKINNLLSKANGYLPQPDGKALLLKRPLMSLYIGNQAGAQPYWLAFMVLEVLCMYEGFNENGPQKLIYLDICFPAGKTGVLGGVALLEACHCFHSLCVCVFVYVLECARAPTWTWGLRWLQFHACLNDCILSVMMVMESNLLKL